MIKLRETRSRLGRSILITGTFVTEKADAEQTGTVATTAAESLIELGGIVL